MDVQRRKSTILLYQHYMYPNFYYIFKDWFGVEWQFLHIINSFGFFVAVSFLLASLFMQLELKRKFKDGVLGKAVPVKSIIGKAIPKSEYITAGISGFILGFKILPILIDYNVTGGDPQKYLLSTSGNFLLGLLATVIFLAYLYYTDRKQRLPEPLEKINYETPAAYMGELTMYAFIGGIIGAKVFHILENMSDFYKDPMGSIASFSGLTFYGGLIVGGAAVIYKANKRGIPFLHMLDVGGPAMMLAYGVGRIGCQVSGDGDWGVVNTSPKPDWMSFLPDWMWSYDYPHNVNSIGVPIPGCIGEQHCNHLVPSVFPTPFYETIMAVSLFLVLWSLRKKLKYAGTLFGIYLIMNGVERFLIEKIRVNTKMEFAGIIYTQAELISACLAILGVVLIVYSNKRKMPTVQSSEEN